MEVIYNFFDMIIRSIGGIYPIGKKIYDIIGIFLSIIVIHKAFYYIIGMFFIYAFLRKY